MSGRSGGFFEGITRETEIIVCDAFSWDRLSPEVILSVVSPQEVLLNKKGSSVVLRRWNVSGPIWKRTDPFG
jgi:hypothetical protein